MKILPELQPIRIRGKRPNRTPKESTSPEERFLDALISSAPNGSRLLLDQSGEADALALLEARSNSSLALIVIKDVATKCSNVPRLLRHAHSALQAGGTIALTVPFISPIKDGELQRLSPDWWQQNLAQLGFHKIDCVQFGSFFSSLSGLISNLGELAKGSDLAQLGMESLKEFASRIEASDAIRSNPFYESVPPKFGVTAIKV